MLRRLYVSPGGFVSLVYVLPGRVPRIGTDTDPFVQVVRRMADDAEWQMFTVAERELYAEAELARMALHGAYQRERAELERRLDEGEEIIGGAVCD